MSAGDIENIFFPPFWSIQFARFFYSEHTKAALLNISQNSASLRYWNAKSYYKRNQSVGRYLLKAPDYSLTSCYQTQLSIKSQEGMPRMSIFTQNSLTTVVLGTLTSPKEMSLSFVIEESASLTVSKYHGKMGFRVCFECSFILHFLILFVITLESSHMS